VLFVQPLSIGKSVAVAGDFNAWTPADAQMRVNRGLGVYELLIAIPPGTYSYRLVIDGVWKPDPFNPATQPNPYGEPNSVLRVSADAARPTRPR
jgi:1,4-alpha-glucan branching enzyme